MYPSYTRGERIVDGCIHAIGVVAGLVAVTALMFVAIPSLPAGTTATLAVYGAGLVSMLAFSAAYHLIPVPDLKGLLRRLDQAAIFVKIAGTYTPISLVKLGGGVGWGLLGTVWFIALFGVVAKLTFAANWNKLAIGVYLGLGWSGIVAIRPLAESLPTPALVLLAVGGLLYTVGVVFHVWDKLRYQNALWHLFVLAGTACHFAAISIAVFTD